MWLDSDGHIGDNSARTNLSHRVDEGRWHMVTLTTHLSGAPGFQMYLVMDPALPCGARPQVARASLSKHVLRFDLDCAGIYAP